MALILIMSHVACEASKANAAYHASGRQLLTRTPVLHGFCMLLPSHLAQIIAGAESIISKRQMHSW